MRWDYDTEIRRRILQRLRKGPAWTRELGCDLRIAPAIIDDAVKEMKADGLIYRPERTLEDGTVTFDRWLLGNPSLIRRWGEVIEVTAAATCARPAAARLSFTART